MELDKNIRSIEEHRKDLLREAEQYRLVQQARTGISARAGIWLRLLSWFYQRLIDVACLLKSPFRGRARRINATVDQNPCSWTV